ncbi:uncharacterized protein LOC130759630 isoform X3 [Actinidia eriantha]|nr:uncharacterized protein LOC130759630 isoform X3 [Actinidia eriantha]
MSLMMSGGDLGVSAFPEGESIFAWIGTIEGGKGTVYEGLSYKLSLRFPLDYPFKPPQVKFETMCFHPNVDQFGNICLDILQLLLDKVDTILHLFCNRTSGLQRMIAELFFCPSRVSWESPTMRVLLTAMLQHYGKTRKITGKWYRSSIFLVKQLKANS